MTPKTKAGWRATQAVPHFDWCAGMRGPNECTCGVVTSIVAIEQEAVAAERERLRAAVGGLEFRIPDRPKSERHPFVKADVALAIESVRAAVLALLEPGDG